MAKNSLGYLALVEKFDLQVPPLLSTSVVGIKSTLRIVQGPDGSERTEYPASRGLVDESVVDMLTFALKREHLNLSVLSALFDKEDVLEDIQVWLRDKPSSAYARQAAYLAHWLVNANFSFELPAGAPRTRLLDKTKYIVGPESVNAQFGVVNNLLGTRELSPLVRRTDKLNAFLDEDLATKVHQAMASLDEEVLHRAVDYLYLSETRSTYGIEDEVPDNNRAAKFRKMLEAAGEPGPLTEEQICTWQRQIVMPLSAEFGYRTIQNWLSRSGRLRNIADFIPPTPELVPSMMDSVQVLATQAQQGTLHPVIAAACASFGFVFVHPMLDGNGRLHRFLIHHVLRQSGFTPAGVVLPISARMLKQLSRYSALLKSYSGPRTALLNYILDSDSGTIFIKSPQPLSLYAYFDATEACEFLMECCKLCVEEDLMDEVRYLHAHDLAKKELGGWLDMRQSQLNTLIDVIVHGNGFLSNRKRKLVEGYTDDQVARIQETVGRHFAEYIDAKA